MGHNWIGFIFRPFIIASIIFLLLGMYFKKLYFLIISAVLVVPLSLYLAVTPPFFLWGLILPLFYISAAIAIKKHEFWLSILKEGGGSRICLQR